MPVLPVTDTKKWNLTMVLASLVASSVLCTMLIMLIATYQSQKSSLTETTLSLNYSNAQKLSVTIESLFQSMRSSLQHTTMKLPRNLSPMNSEIQAYLELVQQTNSYFNSLIWVDETGMIQGVAPASLGFLGKPISAEKTIEALNSQKPFLSNPYVSPYNRLIMLMSEPIFDAKGTYRGMIGGTIYLQENNILSQILGKHWSDESESYFFVVDSKGKLVYHPDRSRLGEDVSANPAVSSVLKGKSGMGTIVNTLGIPMLAAYIPITANGWGVIQQTPVEVVNVQLKEHIRKLILTMLIPYLCLLTAAVLIARRLARPFAALADTVNRVSSGQHVTIPQTGSHWNREADLLTRAVMVAIDTMQKSNEQLAHAATTDPLTGLTNRRTVNELLERWSNDGRKFSFIMMDIDHFKQVNDTFGHQAGDEVLKHMSSILSATTRDRDVCCRFGGEEFVVLLPDTDKHTAYAIAERIRISTAGAVSPIGKPVTVSIGVSEFPAQSDSVEALISLADSAMYKAKQEGRNRTFVAS
ncbi:sensor domain-containing diguanylate cyclase [Paenibacillus thermotolerans]|uniref:sensor domain-containing diguanylate cyclase n=1 Tax=Paenibacillus thermotolerans TaxID=3027807 RepID=UPI00236886D2|nr:MULTISPECIES: sensor domain-containing diguanylate cyclase [unclassified Paenibacillus]